MKAKRTRSALKWQAKSAMSRRHSLHPLSLEERVWFAQTVGLLTSRVVLGPSSQTVHQFSDMVGVVSDYSGGAVPLTSSNIEYSIKLRSSRNDVATCHFIPFASCCGPQYNEFNARCQTHIDDQITQVALCCPATAVAGRQKAVNRAQRKRRKSSKAGRLAPHKTRIEYSITAAASSRSDCSSGFARCRCRCWRWHLQRASECRATNTIRR